MTPSFSGFLAEQDDQKLVTEAFNTAPYDLTFGKKSAGDIFFTFHDEDDKEFRIQFYTPAGLGKNVRQVFIGQKKGASYLDSNQVFKNPMKVVASMIEATKQFLETPIGKGIDGFAINFSKKVMDRGLKLLPKIIRQSGLKQKLNVMDLTFSPDDGRGYVWVIRKGKDPADVFNGPKMKGVTWDDPNKVGDAPPVTPSAGGSAAGNVDYEDKGEWKYTSPNSGQQPEMIYVNKKGRQLYTAALTAHYSDQGTFALNTSDHKNTKGPSAALLISSARLPDVPSVMYNQFIKDAKAYWSGQSQELKVDISKIKRKSNDITLTQRNSSVVMGFTFRKFGTEIDGYSINKVLTHNEAGNSIDVTVTVTNDKGSVLSTASYSFPYKEGVVQEMYDEMREELQSATAQLALIDNDNYNPLKLKVGPVKVGSYGEILVDGTNIRQPSNRGFVLNRITKLTKDEEKRQKEQKNATNMPAPLSQNDWNGFKTTLEGMGFETRTEFRKIFGAMPAGQGKLLISVSRLETGARVLGTLLDSNNFADNAWMKYARDADVVVSSADELKDAVKKIIDFKDQIVGNANPVAVPNQDQEMTTDRWRALCNALTKVKDFRGVTSSTTVSGGVSVGNKGRVQVTMMRGDGKTDDLVKVIIRANDTDSQSIDISPQIVLRGFPLNKPAQLTRDVQAAVNTKIAEINKAIPDSAALDNKAMLKNIETKKSSGRDVEWQIREYQGKIYADWDITFRRNSKTGAFMEYKTEISRANAAINYMKATLENAGYNVQTFILGLDDVRNMDATSDQAYSEYEQSIGGNLVATK